jgi:hypothetical protein
MRELGRNSSFKLVEAPFGGGKTHFLHCLREIGWREGFATALVDVSPDECPFDDTMRIYQAVARSIELPPASIHEAPEPGIDAVLRTLTDRKIAEVGKDQLREWIGYEFRRSPIESHAVRRAVQLFVESILDRNIELEELMGAFLRGESVSKQEIAGLQVREELENRTAFRFLRSLIQVLRQLEVPGVILLFDEMDRVMSLSVKRKKSIGDNLRQMIDHCGQATLPSLLWVYAVPPEFRTSVVPEYPALEQRLRGSARFGPASPLEPVIDLNALPLAPEELFRRIGKRLLELFQVGRGSTLDAEIQEHNLGLLAESMGRDALEVGTRRTFVKQVVHLLHAQALEEKRLERSEIDAPEVADDSASVEDEEDIFA